MLQYQKDLGEMLRVARTALDQSQQEVADSLGITRSAYTYYELGRTTPGMDTLKRLLQLFRLTPEDMFYPERFLQAHRKS